MLTLKKNLNKFVNVFKIIEQLTTETDLNFTPTGLHIRAVHPSNHCFVVFDIDKSFFDDYAVGKDSNYTLNIQLLNKILNTIKGEVYIKPQTDYLKISGDKKDFKLNFFVGSKDVREDPQTIITSKWVVKSNKFLSDVREFLNFNDICKFGGKEGLLCHIKSHMVEGDIEMEGSCVESDGCWSWYDITYIDKLNNLKEVIENLKIGFSSQQPLIIKGEENNIKFKFMLACRVEESEDGE